MFASSLYPQYPWDGWGWCLVWNSIYLLQVNVCKEVTKIWAGSLQQSRDFTKNIQRPGDNDKLNNFSLLSFHNKNSVLIRVEGPVGLFFVYIFTFFIPHTKPCSFFFPACSFIFFLFSSFLFSFSPSFPLFLKKTEVEEKNVPHSFLLFLCHLPWLFSFLFSTYFTFIFPSSHFDSPLSLLNTPTLTVSLCLDV